MYRKLRTILIMLLLTQTVFGQQKPNIIYILADDLGYGDVSCFNKNSKIHTKHIDALAQQGLKFTDAHSNSAVCTPTRYGILTGRYAWRSPIKSGVLWSYDTHLIEPERLTVAALLKKNGYQTACIGKWHLGMDWAKNTPDVSGQVEGGIDFFKPIKNGPTTLGFDYFYGITASLDIPPYFYIQNDKITATKIDSIEETHGKGFWRKGPIGNDFKHEEVLPTMANKAIEFIQKADKNKPYFLYLPLPAPHTPILPTKEYLGKSGTNEYGDFVLMVDDIVGRVMETVKTTGNEKNTIIIFTSDNGCSIAADFKELASLGHNPSGVLRGTKADIFEGGHRIPFIVKWGNTIKNNSVSDKTICLTDFMATCAALMNEKLPDNAGEDSYNLLPLFQNKPNEYQREATVMHSIDGNFSIRKDKWKLVFGAGSGGWSSPKTGKEEDGLPIVQLYDMKNDISETKNVQAENSLIVKDLTTLMTQYVNNGRSTKGAPQSNDGAFLKGKMPWMLNDFMDKRFGMFIHWGPVSLRGTEIGWSRGYQVSAADYDTLYKEFNPTLFNADSWVKAAKDAGMKYVTLTSKHHDGFCLWPTKTSDYNIMSSPFKRDVVGELATACKKQGMTFCLYFTVLDWHDPNYPLHNMGDTVPDPKADMRKFVNTMKSQLTELITNYHPYMLWFDGNWEKPWTQAMGQEIYDHIKKLDPNVVVNNRLGKGNHKVLTTETVGDYATPEQIVGEINMHVPWESCITICNQWAWKPNDKMKSLKESIQTLVSTAAGNGNLLYNVGPMMDGRIEDRQVKLLAKMGDWLNKYGTSIYETKGGPYKPNKIYATTRKGNQIFLHVFKTDTNEIKLPPLPTGIIKKAYFMNGGPLSIKQDETGILVNLKTKMPDENDSVIVFDLDINAENLTLILEK